MERLAALEAEVKADAAQKQARKEAALAKVREQQAAQRAEQQALRQRQAQLVSRTKPAAEPADDEDAGLSFRKKGDDIGNALELARKAQGVKAELTKAPKQGDKSWVKSGLASTVLGPVGWLYAGSLREAIPGAAAWIAFAVLAAKLPWILLFPVLLVAMPLSGIAGLLYAVQYNRKGSRQRLFGDKAKKQLAEGKSK